MKPAMLARALCLGLALGVMAATTAAAAPITLTGNFVQVGISDVGTLGSNFNDPPGMLHDPTGTGNFAPGGTPNDYLTPGSPHESFAINSTQSGFRFNDNNSGSPDFATVSGPTVGGLAGFDNVAQWSGTIAGLVTIHNLYFFNDNDERVNVRTTITALTDLTNLSFARSVDPDPDVNLFNNFDTVNTRGNGTLDPTDLVSSRGQQTGLFLALLNLSGNTYAHNTGINGNCCGADDPANVLLGYGSVFPATSIGDDGLHMAWLIGSLASGASATINYAYVFGADISTVVVTPGPTTAVPEPATIALIGAGLATLATRRRARK
jgi:hypothetical protein